ncbi:sortase domain-containing protein [Cellulomonas soli]|uniref:class F sortase n=1 Tax=Cellulomonas soli TaxID=931535 RepID=UPI003F82473F
MNGEPPRAASRVLVGMLVVLAALTACTQGATPTITPSPDAGTATTSAAPSSPDPTPTDPAWADVPVRSSDLGALPAAGELPAPTRVQVPDVGVDMAVDAVGVQADGSMEVPADADRAGWYRFGATPDSPAGSTVLAAHVDSALTGIGPFARLREVGVGAPVQVTTSDGRTHGYRVVTVEQTAKDGAPVAQWFARDGQPRLVLVTCGGAFRRDIGHYTDNVVVTAEPVPDLSGGG